MFIQPSSGRRLGRLGRGRLGIVPAPILRTLPVRVSLPPRLTPIAPIVGPVPAPNPVAPISSPPAAGWGWLSNQNQNNQNNFQTSWSGNPAWPTSPYGGSSPYGSAFGSNNQANAQSLAAAQALLASNPSLLSPQQFAQLQAAGLIAAGVSYSQISEISPSAGVSTATDSSAIDPTTGVPYATELAEAQAGTATTTSTDIGTTLSETVAGLPLYLWLLIGGGFALLMSRRR